MSVDRVRIARVCTFEKDGVRCGWRQFGDPEANCPTPGHRTILEPNRPYQGRPTPTAEARRG